MSKSSQTPTIVIDCRSVGPGGTDVTMIPDENGLRCVWQNENCPYSSEKERTEVPNIGPIVCEAKDGHNVSRISWESLAAMVQYGRERGWVK